MPTPKQGYYVSDGARVPGVTTVLSKFKEADGLIHWAWDLGMQGKDYRDVRDKAANTGTEAHKLVEDWIRHKKEPPADTTEKAKNAFAQFLEWTAHTRLEPTDTEVRMVSEKHRFGGTLDAMLIGGKLSLGDWKTSNGIYPEYLLQLGGYAILWEENFPHRPIEGGFHLLRFSKDYPDFAHYHWKELEEAKEGFLIMRRLYDIKATLKKRAA